MDLSEQKVLEQRQQRLEISPWRLEISPWLHPATAGGQEPVSMHLTAQTSRDDHTVRAQNMFKNQAIIKSLHTLTCDHWKINKKMIAIRNNQHGELYTLYETM
jgi:hypothetical protein